MQGSQTMKQLICSENSGNDHIAISKISKIIVNSRIACA